MYVLNFKLTRFVNARECLRFELGRLKGFLYSRDFYNILNCFERSFENISGSVLRDTTEVHHGSLL